MDILSEAKKVFDIEKQSIEEASRSLGAEFIRLVGDISKCEGRVIVVGMGKSSHVGAKIASTMSSLGTPTYFLHPAESLHGDLGRITADDIVLFLSKSGESDEIMRMLPSVKKIGAKMVAVTCSGSSTLSQNCDYHIKLNITKEASTYNLAPTSSSTAMMVFGDALAVCLEKLSEFTPDDYAVFHPGGALGKRLLFTVADLMAKGEDIPYLFESADIKDAIVEMSSKAVLGGVAIVDELHHLLGVFTDGDLRRLFKLIDSAVVLDMNITEVMTKDPVSMTQEAKAIDALAIMVNPERSIGILPIVDDDKVLLGMLSIHELIKAGL